MDNLKEFEEELDYSTENEKDDEEFWTILAIAWISSLASIITFYFFYK